MTARYVPNSLKNREIILRRENDNLEFLLRARFAELNRHVKAGDRVLEVGCGVGVTKQYLRDDVELIMTDLDASPWVDCVCDAQQLPFPDDSMDVVFLPLVLHHLPRPLVGLTEAVRVVRPNGYIVVIEPHASGALRLLLSITQHEYIDADVDPFSEANCQTRDQGHWSGNNAIGDLIFEDRERLEAAMPRIRYLSRQFAEFLVFANSGGVNNKNFYVPLPPLLNRLSAGIDKILCRWAPSLFALTQTVVLQKRP